MKGIHGGSRKGSGRKKLEPTKTIRVPIGALGKIEKIINEHKEEQKKQYVKLLFQKSQLTPELNNDQKTRLINELVNARLCKNRSKGRGMTKNPNACKESFFKLVKCTLENENLVGDILWDLKMIYCK